MSTEPSDSGWAMDSPPRHRSVRDSLDSVTRIALIEERLDGGNKAFTRLELSLEKLQEAVKPKRSPIMAWVLGGGFFTIASLVGGIIWQASRYPDRQEFKETIERRDAKIEALSERLEQAKSEVMGMKIRMEERDRTQSVVEKAIQNVGKKVK